MEEIFDNGGHQKYCLLGQTHSRWIHENVQLLGFRCELVVPLVIQLRAEQELLISLADDDNDNNGDDDDDRSGDSKDIFFLKTLDQDTRKETSCEDLYTFFKTLIL